MNIKSFNANSNYTDKIVSFIFNYEKEKNNPNILEFGVREGRSTKLFLEICKKNGGALLSVDIDDYSNLFNDVNWKFLHTRDDNYNEISKYITRKLDIILIDSLHEPNHVEKLIYLYWNDLSLGGSLYIDDISWLPYTKGNWRDHKFTENINRNTFYKILEIQNSNFDKIDLTFSFSGSGMCRIIKKDNSELNEPKKINNRYNTLKNTLKNILNINNK